MREFFEIIAEHPFIDFFLAIFILGILDGIKDIILAFRKK